MLYDDNNVHYIRQTQPSHLLAKNWIEQTKQQNAIEFSAHPPSCNVYILFF